MTRFWSVPREWPGATVAVLASGPSMTQAQADACRGRCRVIAVNNTGLDFAPWADVLFAADAKWWHAYSDRALAFEGLKVTVKPTPFLALKQLRKSAKVFDPDPGYVTGQNSGQMALQLAVHFGAARVILLGFDMKTGLGKCRHYFGDHPPRLNSRPAFATWLNAFRALAPELQKRGVEVIQATPAAQTALRCFRMMTLEDALRGVESRPIATPSDVSATGQAAGSDDGRHSSRVGDVARQGAG